MSEGITAFELCSRVLARTGDDAAPLIALAKGRETGWLEFKATCEPPSDGADSGTNADDYRWHVARAVIAMANTDGGCLLLGVDDAGKAVGLGPSDPRGKIQDEGMDTFIRHLNQTVFCPKNGWRCEKAGKIEVDGGAPLDLVEPVTCHLDELQLLAILVRPREKVLHCTESIRQRERSILLVKHLGDVGEVIEITRPQKIGEWEERRQPIQTVYADILRKFEGADEAASAPLAIIKNILFWLSSLGWKSWLVGSALLAALLFWPLTGTSVPPMWKDIMAPR